MKTNILKVFGFAALLGVAQGAFATVVTTEAELEVALSAGGTVTLGADIALTHEHQVGNTVVLDLATYCLTAADGVNAFQVIANGNFTVNADATNPGGIYVTSTNCCVYTAYGLCAGRKSVTLNGGVFSGNCVFNFSETAAANILKRFGIDVDGAGSGERADPTSVTINGGWFKDGYNQGNIGEYRCYYFTVNGGTFERGIDSADTTTCSIGVTTTCKAFFTGGKYKNHYPWFRWKNRQGEVDTGKVIIGSATHTNVYYYENGYYVNAYDYSACEASAIPKNGWPFPEGSSLIQYLATQCYQKWSFDRTTRRFYRFYSEASSLGNDPRWENGFDGDNAVQDGGSSVIQPAGSTPRMALKSAKPVMLMSAASPANGEATGDVIEYADDNGQGGNVKVVIGKGEDWVSVYGYTYADLYTADIPLKDREDIATSHSFTVDGDVYGGYSDAYADWNARIYITFDKDVKAGCVQVYLNDPMYGNNTVLKDIPALSAGANFNVSNFASGEEFVWDWHTFSFLLTDPDSWPILVALCAPSEDLKVAHVKATVALVLEKGGERITRASFTHTFGGAEDEPVPLDQKDAEVQVPAAADVVQGKTNVKIKEVDAEGNEHDVELNGDFGDKRSEVVVNTMGTIDKEKSIQKAMQETQNGLKEVPVPEDENVTDSSKKLNVELKSIGIDASVAAAPVFESISYLVEPKLKTVETVGGVAQPPEERTISNEEIKASGKSIKVILPLSDDFRVSAKVRHESEDPNYPPEEFILPVLGVAGGRYVEIMTTHFSTFILSPYNAVVTESDETLGIVKVAKTAGGETVAGVPFRKFDVTSGTAKAMTVDQLLVAGFGEGDDIYAYNPAKASGDEYDMWAWDGEKWDIVPGPTQPPAAESAEIASGKAFWFKDESSSTTPLTLAGLYQENVTTTVDVGKKSLLVNPYPVAINAAEKLKDGACAGDQFALVGGSDRYEFRDGAWGVVAKGTVIKELPGGIKIYGSDTFTSATEIVIPAGQAFWYISTGATAPTVAW